MHLIAYTDGASRGNPGESGIGVVLLKPGGEPVARLHGYLGHTTNNRAEYTALLTCVDVAIRLGCTNLTVHSDSELMVRQMSGRYKIKDAELKRSAEQVRELIRRSNLACEFIHVLREENGEADRLANLAIDTKAALTLPEPLQGVLFTDRG